MRVTLPFFPSFDPTNPIMRAYEIINTQFSGERPGKRMEVKKLNETTAYEFRQLPDGFLVYLASIRGLRQMYKFSRYDLAMHKVEELKTVYIQEWV